MGIFQDFIWSQPWTSEDSGPPNIKEDHANDMVLTGIQNCQSTDGLLEQNGEKIRINSLNRAYFKQIALF